MTGREPSTESCRSRVPLAFLALCVAVVAGCGGNGSSTRIGGTVTYNGKPVSHGMIGLYSSGSPLVGGPINPDGTYEVSAEPGLYQVRIDAPPAIPPDWKEADGPPKLGPRLLPEKYADFAGSGLSATVGSASPQTLDFKLP
jgi:hypothetical protein